jgi:hypothetical protein
LAGSPPSVNGRHFGSLFEENTEATILAQAWLPAVTAWSRMDSLTNSSTNQLPATWPSDQVSDETWRLTGATGYNEQADTLDGAWLFDGLGLPLQARLDNEMDHADGLPLRGRVSTP